MKVILGNTYIDLDLITEIVKYSERAYNIYFVGGKMKSYHPMPSDKKLPCSDEEEKEFNDTFNELIKLWTNNQSDIPTLKAVKCYD